MIRRCSPFIATLLFIVMGHPAAAMEAVVAQPHYMPVTDDLPASERVVIDVRSYHSDGKHDFDTLAALAEKRGIRTVVFTEHDRYTIRLGLEPFGGWIGYSMQHPSIYETGVDEFFADLRRVQSKYPDLGLYAGTESTPAYHWSGLPFHDLALHDAERHLITLGLNSPEQLEALPSFTLEHVQGPFLLSMLFWGALTLVFMFLFMRRKKAGAALLGLVSVVCMALVWMNRGEVDADADFIARAKAQRLFVIWTHPGTQSGVRQGPMGVQMDTPPYSDRVFRQPTAEAFAATYGDTDSNSVPGGLWDRYMLDYLHGRQPHPVWAVAAGDYHAEGEANEYLGNFPMDVWMDGQSEASLLAALRDGRNTGWQQMRDRNAGIEVLLLEGSDGRRHLPGGTAIRTGSSVRLLAAAREYVPQKGRNYPPLKGEWVIDGRVAAAFDLPLAGDRLAVCELLLPPGPHLIRLQIPSQQGVKMIANPFLVEVAN